MMIKHCVLWFYSLAILQMTGFHAGGGVHAYIVGLQLLTLGGLGDD